MKSPLNILYLEDDAVDAALVASLLREEGIICAITRVEGEAEFEAALKKGDIDLIFSDYTLPAFDGLRALEVVRSRWPEVPFILVSGTLGEELAIDSLKSGATDYVLKGRLSRLAPAVRRAMLEVDGRAERRQLEIQFIEAQKMEVLGQLAGGVAHDFANVIGVIMGYGGLLTSAIDPGSQLQTYTEAIRQAAERAAGLTRQLLIFSSEETVQPYVLDLDNVVRDLDRMLRRVIDEDIEMTLVFGKDVGRIKADPGYLGQILLNLVINARDAMPNGGKLTISTANITVPGGPPGSVSEEHVVLSVTDTGVGMTEEVKAHIFEAFFTTKPKGKGTGLGLATCQTIARHSGAYIEVESELSKGTTFKIYFPRVHQPLDLTALSVQTGPAPRGTETVLVVEDEPSLRELARGLLEAQGYEVLSASNGQDALKVVRERTGPAIRLVLSDVVMPLMDGVVMAEWLRTQDPELKILFTSGYTDETIRQHGVVDVRVAFLPKPYTPASLTRKVRQLLDAA